MEGVAPLDLLSGAVVLVAPALSPGPKVEDWGPGRFNLTTISLLSVSIL